MRAVIKELKAVVKGLRAEAKANAREQRRVEKLLTAAGGTMKRKRRTKRTKAKKASKAAAAEVVERIAKAVKKSKVSRGKSSGEGKSTATRAEKTAKRIEAGVDSAIARKRERLAELKRPAEAAS